MSKSSKKAPGIVPDEPPSGEPGEVPTPKKAKKIKKAKADAAPAEPEAPRKRKVSKKRKPSGSGRVVSAVVNVATKGLRPMRDEEAKQLRDFVGRMLSVAAEKAKQIVTAGDASERLLAILTKP